MDLHHLMEAVVLPSVKKPTIPTPGCTFYTQLKTKPLLLMR